jgi:hypothetical protein
MIGVSKPFSKSLHAKNDPISRKLVKEFFAERGVILKDHPNKYDIDLMSQDESVRVEVEHRLNWDTPEFPYKEVNVPERKAKFFGAGNTHYVILSNKYSHLGFISAKIIQGYIKDEYLKESRNRFIEKQEYFYKIPSSEFEFYEIL